MKKFLRNLFVLMLIASSAIAQDRTVTGTVTAKEDGLPLPGVSIKVKGTTTGTQTGADGKFSLKVSPEAKVLQFTFVGYTTKEVNLGSSSQINVVLVTDAKQLGEIVVVGYGTATKQSFTGSASVVTAEVLENRPVTSFEKALQGAVAGVTVQSVSGQPGASSTVRIRGVGSISASATPLYVIDGIPISSGDFSLAATTSDVLSTLNPNDIESISVLKDASAGSIYGSRAANGVILITTKKGKSGSTKFNTSINTGYSDIAVQKHQTLDASQYFKQYFDHYYQTNITAGRTPDAAALAANTSTRAILNVNPYNTTNPYVFSNIAGPVLAQNAALYYDTDWRDAVTNRGITKNVNVSAQGGNESTKFFVSGGYFDQKGIILASDFKRYSSKLNLSNQVNKSINIGMNNTLSYTDQNTPAGAGGAANPIRFTDLLAPVYSLYVRDANGIPVKNPDGSPVYNYQNPISVQFNPVGLSEKDEYITRVGRGIINPFAEISFLKSFRFKTNAAVDYINTRERLFYNPDAGNGTAVKGRVERYSVQDVTVTLSNTLAYENKFGLHDVSGLIGQEAYRSKYDRLQASITNLPLGIPEIAAGSTAGLPIGYYTQKRLSSYFGKLSYSYNDKYFLQASYRRDGSSVFGFENRWGDFYSIGTAWRISQEKFLANVKWIDELKVRASYGTSGNDQIGRYEAQGLFGLGFNYNGQSGISYSNLANPALKWEQNTQLDLGLEFSLFNGRLDGEVSYYNRAADGLLYAKPLSFTTGFSSITTNLAGIENKGFDILLNGVPVKTDGFEWRVSANLTTNKNVITKLTDKEVISGTKRLKVGSDIYQWYLRDYAGVDAADGAPTWYRDVLGTDGKPTGERTTTKVYNQATQYDSGSSLAKFTGGFTNNFRYKRFDLTAFVFFSYGAKVYDSYYSSLSHAGSINGQNLSVDVYNSWKKPGDVTNIPKFMPTNTALGASTSTRFLVDGSYMRLKNLTLGYDVDKALARKIGVSSARIFVGGENILTLAKHKGLDPEVSITGLTSFDIPNVQTWSLGLNIGF